MVPMVPMVAIMYHLGALVLIIIEITFGGVVESLMSF